MPTITENGGLTSVRYGKFKQSYQGDPGPFMAEILRYPSRVSSKTYPDRRKYPSDPLFSPTGYSHSTVFQRYGTVHSSNGLYLELNAPRVSSAANKLKGPPSLGIDIRNKVKDQKVNLAVSIAEYGEARKMATGAIEATRRIYELRKTIKPAAVLDILAGVQRSSSRLTGFRRGMSTRVLANNHLAYSFGIAPIISDIDGLLAETRSRITAEFEPFQKRCVVVHEDRVVDEIRYPSNGVTWQIYDSARRKTTVVMWYELDRLGLASIASRFGFLNLAALTWEMIPWSFAVDYLFRVGDTISAMDGFTAVSRMVFTTTTRDNTLVIASPSKGTASSRMLKTTNRSVSPPPALLPHRLFQPDLSFGKTMNIAALLRSTNPTGANWRI